MRRTLSCVLMMTLLLSACGAGGGGQESPDTLAARIRGEYLSLSGWSGRLAVHADYGERVYDFTLDACWEKNGETVLTVAEPELIAGITARVGQDGKYLEYDGMSLSTGPLTGEGLDPLEAVPFLMEQLTCGYMADCSLEAAGEGQLLRVLCRDPDGAEGSGTECVLYLDPESHDLTRAEVLRDGFSVLRTEFITFTKEMTELEASDIADLG